MKSVYNNLGRHNCHTIKFICIYLWEKFFNKKKRQKRKQKTTTQFCKNKKKKPRQSKNLFKSLIFKTKIWIKRKLF